MTLWNAFWQSLFWSSDLASCPHLPQQIHGIGVPSGRIWGAPKGRPLFAAVGSQWTLLDPKGRWLVVRQSYQSNKCGESNPREDRIDPLIIQVRIALMTGLAIKLGPWTVPEVVREWRGGGPEVPEGLKAVRLGPPILDNFFFIWIKKITLINLFFRNMRKNFLNIFSLGGWFSLFSFNE